MTQLEDVVTARAELAERARRRWPDAFLDEMRTKGDPLADAVVASLYKDAGSLGQINALMQTLVRDDGLPPEQLPVQVLDYLRESSAIPGLDSERVREAEKLFAAYGPEILTVLGFYSLPLSYAAHKGVQVLYRTGYLEQRATRRVFETAQLLVDAFSPGGLGPDGKGIRTAQKVRLMHAAVRFLLTNDPQNPWDPALGVPINQEDMAGTFTVFTVVVMKYGLAKLGIDLPLEAQETYLHAWRGVAALMGVDPRLLPERMAEVDELACAIQKRQFSPSPEGTALTTALLAAFQKLMPPLLGHFPSKLMHHFLNEDPYSGENIATWLGLPPERPDGLAEALIHVGQRLGVLISDPRSQGAAARHVSMGVVNGIMLFERGGTRPAFSLAPTLYDFWNQGR